MFEDICEGTATDQDTEKGAAAEEGATAEEGTATEEVTTAGVGIPAEGDTEEGIAAADTLAAGIDTAEGNPEVAAGPGSPEVGSVDTPEEDSTPAEGRQVCWAGQGRLHMDYSLLALACRRGRKASACWAVLDRAGDQGPQHMDSAQPQGRQAHCLHLLVRSPRLCLERGWVGADALAARSSVGDALDPQRGG